MSGVDTALLHLVPMCLRTGNCLNKRGKHTHSSQNLKQSNQYQVAMSLHWLSDEALKVYNGFYFDGEEHAVGQVNVAFQFSSEKNSKAIRGLSKSCSLCAGCADSRSNRLGYQGYKHTNRTIKGQISQP